jgi:hypothetical protein
LESLKGRYNSEDLCENRRLILKWLMGSYVYVMWIAIIWFWTWTGIGLL